MTKRKAVVTKEEEIELNESEEPKPKTKKIDFDKPAEEIDDELIHTKQPKPHSQVPDKYIKDLTEEDRLVIIKNYSDGFENDHYTIKMLKNGGFNIYRKKTGRPTSIDDSIIKRATSVKGRVGNQSTEQFALESIMKLNQKISKIKDKQKKLKKKYKRIKSDIYVDDEDDTQKPQIEKVEEKTQEEIVEEPEPKNIPQKEVQQEDAPPKGTPPRNQHSNSAQLQRKMTLREILLLRQQQMRF